MLKNKLLERLGAFSHLVLDALTLLPERGIEWVINVTGINLQQLDPILNRLNSLGLIKNRRLSRQGEILVLLKRNLHGQTRYIYLDGNYKNYLFYGDKSLRVIELPENRPFVIRLWNSKNGKLRNWPCENWTEDCARQKNRILSYPVDYLTSIFAPFKGCFIDKNFSVKEWDLDVCYMSDKPAHLVIEVPLHPEDMHPDGEFIVASPVICLSTRYRIPERAPVELCDEQPEDECHTMSFAPNTIATELYDEAGCSLVWPEVDECAHKKATKFLFSKISMLSSQVESCFNRDHYLKDCWQKLGFNKSTIEKNLRKISGIHFIKE